jgi:hypothetical protein
MMCAMKPVLWRLLTLVPLLAIPAMAVEWTPLRKNEGASLSIDRKSVQRKGDEASFQYMVEFPTPQGNPSDGVIYRSLVVNASVRCGPRAIAIGKTDAYLEPGAQGKVLATTRPPRGLALFKPVEPGTSDEDLWQLICERKKAAPKK